VNKKIKQYLRVLLTTGEAGGGQHRLVHLRLQHDDEAQLMAAPRRYDSRNAHLSGITV